jgi:hypothetical protein
MNKKNSSLMNSLNHLYSNVSFLQLLVLVGATKSSTMVMYSLGGFFEKVTRLIIIKSGTRLLEGNFSIN